MAIVQSNKMIAICHYGGEFETNEDGSVSYGGRETYAVIDDNMHLTDFKQEIAEAIGSAVDGMLLKYFLPGDKKNLITVSKDEDFNQMVNFYKGSDELEVFIMKESSPVKPASRLQKRPAETQVAAILPPDLGSPNIIPPNEAIGIETTNGIANDLIHDHAREQLLDSFLKAIDMHSMKLLRLEKRLSCQGSNSIAFLAIGLNAHNNLRRSFQIFLDRRGW
ncbi:hypothetical protein L1987_12273 [Smallanthus sonchifolius]|uniref:Uncharacterized protein n=1 Tax=Smallanthus sonchifolius TaxID=185202 RepID=A0ACB9JE71_9ASTR|nr:hypothetical protein L1987_12273 [Smallanthus sonchifolius]